MSRKVQRGNVTNMNTVTTSSWSRGRYTRNVSKVKVEKKTGELYRVDSSYSLNVFGLVFIVLLAVALFSFLNQSEVKTFASFLEMLSNVPDVSGFIINWVKTASSFLITNIPALDFIIKMGTGGISMVIILLTGLVQAFIFILSIFAWVLV